MCLAIPGRLIELIETKGPRRRGRVAFGQITKEVNLAFVPEAAIGDHVLVHVGVALSLIDEAEAGRIFELLDEMELTELK
jgi:hydrogenase expression/formation protein HypC